jgi:hypothetical protein
MTDINSAEPDPECDDAKEAADMGEKPDLGRKADTLIDALDGTDSGSDTRAGSLRGGSASGSDDDPDSAEINEALAEEGRAEADPDSPSDEGPDGIAGSDKDFEGKGGDPAEGSRGG